MVTLNDFSLDVKIGDGSYGSVYKAIRKQDNKQYALKKVKLMHMKQKQKLNAVNQIRLLASIDHPNVISYKQAFLDQQTQCLCIVMQYASNGDLLKKIKLTQKNLQYIPQEQIWKCLFHLLLGLKQLHQRNIIHRDLKSANIFIDQFGNYKIGDLNVSKVLKNGLAHTQTGTPYYASPQVWKEHPYNEKSDMWSLGCIIFQMAALSTPFKSADLQGLYKRICNGKYQKIPSRYSDDLNTILKYIFKINPKNRPSAKNLLESELFKKKYKEYFSQQFKEQKKKLELLKTININFQNLKNIQCIFPKPRYFINNQQNLDNEGQNQNQQAQQAHKNYRVYSLDKIGTLQSPLCSQKTYLFPLISKINKINGNYDKISHHQSIISICYQKKLHSLYKKKKINKVQKKYKKRNIKYL